jgi:hypothetical protein
MLKEVCHALLQTRKRRKADDDKEEDNDDEEENEETVKKARSIWRGREEPRHTSSLATKTHLIL